MYKNYLITKFRNNLRNEVWLFLALFLLQELVGIRSFIIRNQYYPSEIIFMPISILFWSTLPVAIIALIRSFKTSFCKALGLIARWIVYISATALFVLENYLLSAYKSLYTDSIAVNILATNKDEATGFLEVIPPSYILFPLISAVALLVVLNLLIRPLQKKITHWIVEVVYFLISVLKAFSLSIRVLSHGAD